MKREDLKEAMSLCREIDHWETILDILNKRETISINFSDTRRDEEFRITDLPDFLAGNMIHSDNFEKIKKILIIDITRILNETEKKLDKI